MKFWIGITDNDWYKYLSTIQPDEINFWQRSARGLMGLETGPQLCLILLNRDYYE
jgi:hypothetical protein